MHKTNSGFPRSLLCAAESEQLVSGGGGRGETKLSAQGETTGSGIEPLSGSMGAGTRPLSRPSCEYS